MTKKALADENYERIKNHILNPDDSPLEPPLQNQLNRLISMAKVLDKNPVMRHSVALHRKKFPELSASTAYRDARLAKKLYNSLHQFDFDFWQAWILKDITENIQQCKDHNTPTDRRIIAMEHANLLKAIGEKPEDMPDPHRNEKHQFYILVQTNNTNVKINLDQLNKLPDDTIRELNRALSGGNEIDDQGAAEIMKT